MGLVKPSYTDPNTGAVYPNVYLKPVRVTIDLEGYNGRGNADITVAVYANKAAQRAGRTALTRFNVQLVRQDQSKAIGGVMPPGVEGLTFKAIYDVFGAPVEGKKAKAMWNTMQRSIYAWLADPANAASIGFDLSDATEDAEDAAAAAGG